MNPNAFAAALAVWAMCFMALFALRSGDCGSEG